MLINRNASTIENKIICLDANSKQKLNVIFNGDQSALLNNFDSVSVADYNNTLYMMFYDNNFSSGAVVVSLTSNVTDCTVSAPKSITFTTTILGQLFNNFHDLSLGVNTSTGMPYAIVHSGETLFHFEISSMSNEISQVITTSFSVPATTKVYSCRVSESNYLLLQHGTTFYAYAYEINKQEGTFRVSSTDSSSSTISLSSIDSLSYHGNNLTLTSTTDKKVLNTTLSSFYNNLSFGENVYITNPEITIEYFAGGNIKFMEALNSSSPIELKNTPYANESLATVTPQSKIVHIGSGYMRYTNETTLEKVNGYEYFLYTTIDGVNHYGFLAVDKVTDLDTPSVDDRTYVYVRGNSPIFKYPTRTTLGDSVNSIIYTTTDLTRFEVVRDIQVFAGPLRLRLPPVLSATPFSITPPYILKVVLDVQVATVPPLPEV